MKTLRFLMPAVILLGGISVSYGKPEYTKKESAKCAVCHSKGKELNKVGECYKEKKALKGCEADKK